MKRSMAANTQKLIKDWIEYLKNFGIAAKKSDPETGKLHYYRPVTSKEIIRFLEITTYFTPEQINNAIQTVLAKKVQGGENPKLQNNPTPEKPGTDVSTWMHSGMRPSDPKNRLQGEPAEQPEPTPGQNDRQANNKFNYGKDDVSDIDYREVPNRKPEALPGPTTKEPVKQKVKPRFKLRPKRITEDITDNTGYQLGEKDVEEIFNILASDEAKQNEPANTAQTPEKPKPDPRAELNILKKTIRDVMTDEQRKSLWRALNEV